MTIKEQWIAMGSPANVAYRLTSEGWRWVYLHLTTWEAI
jgi:hypothetical protein